MNKITPETKSIIIILLFGWVLYSQINLSTREILEKNIKTSFQKEKEAEEYAQRTAVDINRHVRLLAHKDLKAFNVLLLSYHNTKQSLQGYKYLYLSCLTEAPKAINAPLLKTYWSNLDYVYYVDELEKLHNLEIVQITNIEEMDKNLPKLKRLLELSEAKAASFYVIEGVNNPIGIVVFLYKEDPKITTNQCSIVLPSILKLAILLDYDNIER